MPEFDFQPLLDYCSLRLDRLECDPRSKITQKSSQKILSYIGDQASKLDGYPTMIAGRHNDFAPHNIIVKDSDIAVLDFTMFDYGSVCTMIIAIFGIS